MMTFVSVTTPRDAMPIRANDLEYYRIKSDAVMSAEAYIENVEFRNWAPTTKCFGLQSIVTIPKTVADYVPIHYFNGTKFHNVDEAAMPFFFEPPEAWGQGKECGEFPCTGPLNVILDFKENSLSGSVQPVISANDFKIISNNTNVSDNLVGCS